jgi:hypothetical protein
MSINLLPPGQRARRMKKRAAVRWMVGGMVEVALVAVSAVGLHVTSHVDDRSVRGEMVKVEREIEAIEGRKAERAAAVGRVEAEMQLRDTVNAPADYSKLLAVVSAGVGEEGVMTSLKWDVSPAPTTAAAPVDADGRPLKVDAFAGPVRLTVQMTGLVRSQAAITRVVERIEKAGVFDEVRLVKSGRDAFLGSEAFSFQLSCVTGGMGSGVQK